jgi:hypothetical protein
MENEQKTHECCEKKHKCKKGARGFGGCAYGLGFVGALIFFIQHADTFWVGVLGFFKALFWPAFIVYKLLDFLK